MTNRRPISIIGIVSAVAIAFLFWLIYGYESGADSDAWAFLPAMNASFNALSASLLVLGLYFIRTGNKRAHGFSMAGAFTASSLFLVGYIAHHAIHGDTKFVSEGWIRPVYFLILATHILLSMAVLPMVLTTLFFAATRKWKAHRSLAKWTWPIWLYVSVTGVLVFFFLRFLNA